MGKQTKIYKSAIAYSHNSYSFFPTFGRNMKVILFFLLVIIASARVGNACSGAGADEIRTELNGSREEYWRKEPTPYFEKAKRWAKRWTKRWTKRWAKNEKTQKIRANLSPAFTMEKNMAMNMAKNTAKNTAKNDKEYA